MQAGTRLGHYDVLSAIGKGGMGEVWKARDTKLRREVALKTLPPELALDPELVARLEREARLLAAVNHPNIASIYGLEEQARARFLVLELVEGDTLADRLRRGPMPVEQALGVALQIASALEAAHGKGVVHRDLKPANVNITPDGRVKVLDFGLARMLMPDVGDPGSELTLRKDAGLIMGTAPYMSPEQARGEAATFESDIWSFGVVLYEMLTGKSPFERATAAETLACVLAAKVDFASLPANTPSSARRLLKRCLDKDPQRRYRHTSDLRIEVEGAREDLAAEAAQDPHGTRAARRRPFLLTLGALATVALAAVAGYVAWSVADRSAIRAPPAVARLSVTSFEPPFAQPFGVSHVAISDDGSMIAYGGARSLWIRRLREQDAVRVDVRALSPFFSPDGDWLGFFSLSDGWQKMPITGGAPMSIAYTTERPAGAAWSPDGTIVFAMASGLHRVPADGGEPHLLIAPDRERGELLYAWPQFLPGGRSLLFTIVREGSIEGAQIASLDLESLEMRVVLTGGTSPRYLSTGHLVYATGETLMAVAFDSATYVARGDPVAVRDVTIATAADTGAAEYGVSATGTLAYLPPSEGGTRPLRTLVWVDREGNEEPLPLEPGTYGYPRISPDGTRVALDVTGSNRDIWIWDLNRAILARLTEGPTEDLVPLWSPNGQRVFFASNRTGNLDVYSQPADGSGEARVEFASPATHVPSSFTPDGRELIVTEDFRDVNVIELGGELKPLLQREADDWLGDISPDGHWIAHESNESGAQIEIYLRPFPDVGGQREKVSLDGGRYPHWGSLDSAELYYVDLDGGMMAVPIELTPTLRVGRPTKLFDTDPPPPGITGLPYDVAPDGRFIIAKDAESTSPGSVNVSVVLNWFEELREQVPVQ